MKKTNTILIIALAAFLAACGAVGGGKSEITTKVGDQEKKFEPTSTWAYHSTKNYSLLIDGNREMSTSSITTVFLANFELDSSQAFISLGKQKLDKPEQVKVTFDFSGEKGSTVETSVVKGEYTPEIDDKEKYMKISSVTIYRFLDGKQEEIEFDRKKTTGKLTINGVSGTTVSGQIDISDGKNSIKGTFSANGDKSVK
ncbi:MAG: hypothetical protein WBO10_12365 [Pyrinomonadaceae bacterium]